MKRNYLTYPCKYMRITQNCTGKASHLPHSSGKPADYPFDEGCEGSGKSYMYCPCDSMRVARVYGVGSKGINTVWLESTEKVVFADGSEDYCTLLITHPDDDSLKKLYAGKIFRRGEPVCTEGRDGCSGNHFHFSAGKGKIKGNGWVKNNKGKWVLACTSGAFPPERLFFVDPDFTKILDSKGFTFRPLPVGYDKGSYKVTAKLLNVRTGPGTEYKKKKFSDLTEDARAKILSLCGCERDGYVKGLTFTAYAIEGSWGRTPSGWVCLDYCEVIK